jgi:adenosylhomocysteine nucleosidase
MPKIAIVAALEREIAPLVKHWIRIQREYEGRKFTFFEHEDEDEDKVAVCGGIGLEAARRAAEAVIALYHPTHLHSVGFAGALNSELHVGEIFSPAVLIDARNGSRHHLEVGEGALVTFMAVADPKQKSKLAEAYRASAVDMEAAAVASAAQARGIAFSATKVISDELDFEIPRIARFITAEGQFNTGRFVFFAALRPWLWKSVAALASNSKKAAQSLCAHLERSRREAPKPSIADTANAAENALHARGGKA